MVGCIYIDFKNYTWNIPLFLRRVKNPKKVIRITSVPYMSAIYQTYSVGHIFVTESKICMLISKSKNIIEISLF